MRTIKDILTETTDKSNGMVDAINKLRVVYNRLDSSSPEAKELNDIIVRLYKVKDAI